MANKQDYPEEFAKDVRNMMQHFNLPYIEVNTHNENDEVVNSPLKTVSYKIEALINALLGDIMFAGMEEGSFLLNHLENQIEDLLQFSSYLRLRHEKGKLDVRLKKEVLKNISNKRKSEEENPVPKVFTEALADILAKSKNKDNRKTHEKDK